MITKFSTCLFAAGLAFLPSASSGSQSLLPAPKSIQTENGTTALSFRIQPVDDAFQSQAAALGEALEVITGQPCSMHKALPKSMPIIHAIVNASWDPLYIVDHYPRTMFTAVCSEELYNFDIKRFKHVNHGFPTYAKPQRIKSTKGVLGFCMPWWEGREENLFPICRQRLNAVTARVWNDEGEASFDSFLERDAKLQMLLDTIRPWKGEEPTAGWPDRKEDPTPGNLAHGKPVSVSAGASQPQFGPQRLTNGATDRFDHFLGYPTVPEPLEITIDLGEVRSIGRVDVYEAAVGKSWEKYEVSCSTDNRVFKSIGKTGKGGRGETNKVSFACPGSKARYVRLSTDGCQDLTFPSFSRLCEVMVFEE